MEIFKICLLAIFVGFTIYSLMTFWVRIWDLYRRIERLEKEMGIKDELGI